MVHDVLRTGRVRPIDGTPAATRIRHLRQTLRRRVWGPRLLLPRSIPLHGLRPTDVPREPARHRDVPPVARAQALPCRLPWADRPEHACRCESGAGLANLCRFRSGIDQPCSGPLCRRRRSGLALEQTAYALDSTTIDLCLKLFPWAPFRRHKAAVKLHTLIDLRGNIPTFVHISSGKRHDVTALDELPIEAGAFYVMDRRYLDFGRLNRLHRKSAFFITRAKRNLDASRTMSRKVDKTTGLR